MFVIYYIVMTNGVITKSGSINFLLNGAQRLNNHTQNHTSSVDTLI